jgi:hypothetical protein
VGSNCTELRIFAELICKQQLPAPKKNPCFTAAAKYLMARFKQFYIFSVGSNCTRFKIFYDYAEAVLRSYEVSNCTGLRIFAELIRKQQLPAKKILPYFSAAAKYLMARFKQFHVFFSMGSYCIDCAFCRVGSQTTITGSNITVKGRVRWSSSKMN